MNEKLKSDLASADPVAGGEDATLHGLVQRMARDAQAAAATGTAGRSSWWKRPRAMVPMGLVALVAVTGAAVLIPLQLGINGTHVELDAEIPIVYTTDTGVEVSCRFGIYFGDPADRSPADERLASFMNEHDWTGIGQRIYDEAIADPFVPGPNDEWEVDTPELRDQSSFFRATEVIWEEIPDNLMHDGWSSGSTMDCKGQLH